MARYDGSPLQERKGASLAGPLRSSLGVEEASLRHECIKGIKGGRGGRGPLEPRSVKGLSPEVQRPAGVGKEEE